MKFRFAITRYLLRAICLSILLSFFVCSPATTFGQTTQVILLGTGTPYPDPKASGPATAIKVGNRFFLFDAGPGVMRQINAARLPISGPEAVFFTHLHSDHTLGYADLVLTSWVMRRQSVIPVYGPHGLLRMTNHLLAAFSEDIAMRTNGLEGETANGYRVKVHEIGPGVVYERDGVRVTAIKVNHGSWKEAYGYRIDTPDRSIVISGDTRPSEALIEAATGLDTLVHEVYLAGRVAPENRPRGNLWPRYMREFHTSDLELGAIANRVKPRLLILTHIGRFDGTDEEIFAGIRKGGYTGRVIIGKDLDVY